MWIVFEAWIAMAAFAIGIWVYAVPVAAWRKMRAEEAVQREIASRPMQPEVIYRDRPFPVVADEITALEMIFKRLGADDDERESLFEHFAGRIGYRE